MNLGSSFERLGPDEVRLRGTRVGVEIVLNDHLNHGLTAVEIASQYPTVTLEQVEATLDLLKQDPEYWGRYLDLHREAARQAHAAAAQDNSERMQRLRRLKATLQQYPPDQRQGILQKLLAEEREEVETPAAPIPVAGAA